MEIFNKNDETAMLKENQVFIEYSGASAPPI